MLFCLCASLDNSTVVQKFDPNPDSDENWVIVTGLRKGKYEVWAVASSGIGEFSREHNSQSWILHIGLKNDSGKTSTMFFNAMITTCDTLNKANGDQITKLF